MLVICLDARLLIILIDAGEECFLQSRLYPHQREIGFLRGSKGFCWVLSLKVNICRSLMLLLD